MTVEQTDILGDEQPAESLDNETLVQVLIESYQRSVLYPNARFQHDRWVECKTEVLSRLTRATAAAPLDAEIQQVIDDLDEAAKYFDTWGGCAPDSDQRRLRTSITKASALLTATTSTQPETTEVRDGIRAAAEKIYHVTSDRFDWMIRLPTADEIESMIRVAELDAAALPSTPSVGDAIETVKRLRDENRSNYEYWKSIASNPDTDFGVLKFAAWAGEDERVITALEALQPSTPSKKEVN